MNRGKKLELEAQKEENYRPTSELKADEDKPKIEVPWTALIICGVLVVLIAICITLVFVLGGPIK